MYSHGSVNESNIERRDADIVQIAAATLDQTKTFNRYTISEKDITPGASKVTKLSIRYDKDGLKRLDFNGAWVETVTPITMTNEFLQWLTNIQEEQKIKSPWLDITQQRVAEILLLPKNSKQRKDTWEVLRNEANYIHNFEVIQNQKGTIIPRYRPTNSLSTSNYLPCEFCKGMFAKSNLNPQRKKCNQNKEINAPATAVRTGKDLLPVPKNICSSFYKMIVMDMKDDTVKKCLMTDALIMTCGERLYERMDVEEHTPNTIRQKLGHLGRLVDFAKQQGMAFYSISDFIQPTNFEALLSTIKKLAGRGRKENCYVDLAKFTLCEVSLFNRKRGGEVQRLTVARYLKGKTSNALDKDILSSLTDFEIQLCKSHIRVEIRGKFGRTVPIILTKSMILKLDTLLELRDKEQITNKYVFSRPVPSTKPYRGSDVLREIKGMVCLKQPEAFTFTALRKHIATLTQLNEINDTMQDQLAQFLGHDIRVHR
ncbi:Hypothetical predicted protein [Mytilus galloprovincialis]|uniref:Uncharacterized protein n=1 Tax=Mytilus galloprovincialis TaxID=29158 RepID=A0A8B6DY86_MYTGA|nr:Hypothetical predicted protein [Mytilus galloprovincialis]